MAPHAIKRRKLGHDNDSREELRISKVASGSANDKEYITSDDDGPITSAPKPPLASQTFEKGGPRTELRDGTRPENQMYRSSNTTLQVRALLEEVRPNYANLLAVAEPLLRKLKAHIEGFPEKEPRTVR